MLSCFLFNNRTSPLHAGSAIHRDPRNRTRAREVTAVPGAQRRGGRRSWGRERRRQRHGRRQRLAAQPRAADGAAGRRHLQPPPQRRRRAVIAGAGLAVRGESPPRGPPGRERVGASDGQRGALG
jgi:hypothetical protein